MQAAARSSTGVVVVAVVECCMCIPAIRAVYAFYVSLSVHAFHVSLSVYALLELTGGAIEQQKQGGWAELRGGVADLTQEACFRVCVRKVFSARELTHLHT